MTLWNPNWIESKSIKYKKHSRDIKWRDIWLCTYIDTETSLKTLNSHLKHLPHQFSKQSRLNQMDYDPRGRHVECPPRILSRSGACCWENKTNENSTHAASTEQIHENTTLGSNDAVLQSASSTAFQMILIQYQMQKHHHVSTTSTQRVKQSPFFFAPKKIHATEMKSGFLNFIRWHFRKQLVLRHSNKAS